MKLKRFLLKMVNSIEFKIFYNHWVRLFFFNNSRRNKSFFFKKNLFKKGCFDSDSCSLKTISSSYNCPKSNDDLVCDDDGSIIHL